MSTICVSLTAPSVHIVSENERDCCIEVEEVIRKAVSEGSKIIKATIMCADHRAAQRVADYLGDLHHELKADQKLARTSSPAG